MLCLNPKESPKSAEEEISGNYTNILTFSDIILILLFVKQSKSKWEMLADSSFSECLGAP